MTLSPYLIAVLAGWIVAQGLKYILVAVKNRNFDHIRQLYLSGNMPSAHSATTVSLAVVVGMKDGIDSALFGIAALLASVVMYDAIMVRRSVGEQGIAIQTLIKLAKNQPIVIPRAARGHTPLEVLVGASLGVVIGIIVYLTTI